MSGMLTQEFLRSANQIISDWIGVSVSDERLGELETVLEDAMATLGFDGEEKLLERLRLFSPAIASFLIPRLTIPETYFFRDKEVFNGLRDILLPTRLKEAQKKGTGEVVVWCAACSSGEEAYSIAAVCKYVDPAFNRVRVLASDINPESISRAKQGKYKLWSFREKVPRHFEQFFVEAGYNETLVIPDLRASVDFFELNLLDIEYPPPLDQRESVDILFCRNVLMYFSSKAKQKLVDRFVGLLKPGGYLLVAPCELSSICHPQLELLRFEGFHGLKKAHRKSDTAVECLAKSQDSFFPMPRETARQVAPSADVQHVSASTDCSQSKKSDQACRSKKPIPMRRVPVPVQAPTSEQDRGDGPHPPGAPERTRLAEEMFLQSMDYLETGDKQEALVGLRKTLYLDPAFVMAHVHLGFLVSGPAGRRHLERAISLLEKLPADAMVPFGDNSSVETILEALRDNASRTVARLGNPHYSESM